MTETEVKKNVGGRPSKTAEIDKEQVKKLILKGFTDKEVSEFFGITEQTFNNWKLKDPKFFEALKDWKLEADAKVERALYESACGYRTKYNQNIVVSDGKDSGSHVEVHEAELVCPPNATSIIFWLKNRQPDKWRDRQEVDLGDKTLDAWKDVSTNKLQERAYALLAGRGFSKN